MRLLLVVLIANAIGYVFPQEIMIQPVLQRRETKLTLKEDTGITVHPGDSLYLEVTSSIPSQVAFFGTTAPVNIAIRDGDNTVVREHYTGVVAFNNANIVRTYAQYFKHGRKLILNFEDQQGLKDIVLPIY